MSNNEETTHTGAPAGLATLGGGPTYATAQLLVQQVAYTLSDKIFAYSGATFDLDAAARHWQGQQAANAHGYATDVVALQTRAGAGALALGHLFSADVDAGRRAVPRTLVATTGSLHHLRGALDQLARLYGAASPVVAHVAALDSRAARAGEAPRLAADYGAALQTADALGLALVASASAAEAQHLALFATLAAQVVPTLHVYDGLRAARERVRVADALSTAHVGAAYARLAAAARARLARTSPRQLGSAVGAQLLALLQDLNAELGTTYAPFAYHGHADAEVVLVALGSAEAALAAQTAARLAAQGRRVGAVVVRLYRPFLDDAFLSVLPATVRRIAVLGQVAADAAVHDAAVQSALFADVLAAVAFSGSAPWAAAAPPAVVDAKYAATEAPTPALIAAAFAEGQEDLGEEAAATGKLALSLVPAQTRQYTFWELDDSPAAAAGVAAAVARALAAQPGVSVAAHDVYDNLVQGGVVRSDVRQAPAAPGAAPLQAPFAVEAADVVAVGDAKLLGAVDVLAAAAQPGAALLLRLPGFAQAADAAQEAEKRIPAAVRKALHQKQARLFVLDPDVGGGGAAADLAQQAFLRVAQPALAAPSSGSDLDKALTEVAVPAAWAELPADFVAPRLVPPGAVQATGLGPFDKTEAAAATATAADWQAAAKGLVFKEAYGTRAALRPDQPVRTAQVTVAENRRLTPADYDRNIFHIEFDLGASGLRYEIGEALAVHADNDAAQVAAFLAEFGYDGAAVVQVPAREDGKEGKEGAAAAAPLLETRTVFQALVQNVDILGRPPKRFYEALADFAADPAQAAALRALGGKADEAGFQRRSEVDTVTYADVLREFGTARPPVADLVRIVAPTKRREYSIASAQAATPTRLALLVVVVDWVDTAGRTRYGQASRYLSRLPVGAPVTVSVKPSVMKLPASPQTPLVLAGLGTGLAPFRAFVQHRALQKARGEDIGAILLFLGARHQREEYLYGEEWEAYVAAGVVTLLGAAFSRDQPAKIYIQDRMREHMDAVVQAYIAEQGAFFLCGPTWPVPSLTDVLKEAIATEAAAAGRKVDPAKEIDRLKESGRYVLEVY